MGFLSKIYNKMSDSNKRQFKGGMAVTAVAFAAFLGVETFGTPENVPVFNYLSNPIQQSWPFHLMYFIGANILGASGAAMLGGSRDSSPGNAPAGPAP